MADIIRNCYGCGTEVKNAYHCQPCQLRAQQAFQNRDSDYYRDLRDAEAYEITNE